jgi:hypothetical protein
MHAVRLHPSVSASRTKPNFAEWVTAEPPLGLKTTLENLQEIAKGDQDLTDALDKALAEQYPHGVHRDLDNVKVTTYSDGNSRAQALRRLRKDRPDLHARVLGGEFSANEAMIRAGWRRRTLTIRADDPSHAARTIRKHYTDPEQFRLLVKLLTEQENQSCD